MVAGEIQAFQPQRRQVSQQDIGNFLVLPQLCDGALEMSTPLWKAARLSASPGAGDHRRWKRAHNPPACAENLSHQVSAQCAILTGIPTGFVDDVLARNQRRFWRQTQGDGNQVFPVTVKNARRQPKNRKSLIFVKSKSHPFQFRPLMRTRERFRYFGPLLKCFN
jgi:hypothetical protein